MPLAVFIGQMIASHSMAKQHLAHNAQDGHRRQHHTTGAPLRMLGQQPVQNAVKSQTMFASISGQMTLACSLATVLVPIFLHCLNCTKLRQLILRKIVNIVATRCHILRLKCNLIRFRLGLRPVPRPCWRSSALPIPLFKGSYFYTRTEGRERGGKRREERGRRGREEEGKGGVERKEG